MPKRTFLSDQENIEILIFFFMTKDISIKKLVIKLKIPKVWCEICLRKNKVLMFENLPKGDLNLTKRPIDLIKQEAIRNKFNCKQIKNKLRQVAYILQRVDKI